MQNNTRLALLLSAFVASGACGGSKSGAPRDTGAHRAVAYEADSYDSDDSAPTSDFDGESEAMVAQARPSSPPGPTLSRAISPRPTPSPVASTESYAGLDENHFHNSQQQSVSTFSIDVDTASYSNARRFLTSGHLPPASAVRIEEFVNYFRYDYADPTGEAPFAIHSNVTTAPWNTAHEIVRIGLQGTRMDTADLPKRNLVFLIDVSGSMASHDKLPLLREGFKMLSKTLREEDFVSIVVYAGAAGAVLLPTSGADQGTIMGALDTLRSGGSTNGGQGIQLAYKLAEQNFDPDAINRVILASDGDFNVGMTDKDTLIHLIEEKRKSGVYLSVLGFGRGNLKDATMEQIADKGNGNYSYIDNAAEARKVLVDEGGSTLITIAKDVKVQVDFNTDVVDTYRLIGYENRILAKEDFDNDKVDAGELGPGHSVTALYEITRKDKARSATLATVKLRYKRPDSNTSQLLNRSIANRVVPFATASQDMRFATTVAGFGLLLRRSKYRGDLTWATLQSMAEDAVKDHPSALRHEFVTLIGMASTLAGPEVQLAR